MSLSAQEKTKIISEFGTDEKDTGLVEAQVALLTADIEKLTEHFKQSKKDIHSRQGLMTKVNQRRKLLAYLRDEDVERYRKLIEKLGLRGLRN